jgi:hypothetical protein
MRDRHIGKHSLDAHITAAKQQDRKMANTKSWLTGEFDWRARQAKKEIIDNKVKEMLDSDSVISIPGTEAEILAKYYDDKSKKEAEAAEDESETSSEED